MITAEAFAATFLKIAASKQEQLDARLGDPNQYTGYVLDAVLPEVAESLGCTYKREHRRIDFVLFPTQGRTAHYFYAAIEHENAGDRAPEELIKLSLLNVPLKVLITYVYFDAGVLREYLAHLGEVLTAMDYFGDFADKRRQLLILGRRNPHAPRAAQSEVHLGEPVWTSYIWNGKKFVPQP